MASSPHLGTPGGGTSAFRVDPSAASPGGGGLSAAATSSGSAYMRSVDVHSLSNYVVEAAPSVRKHKDQTPFAKLTRLKARYGRSGTVHSVEAVILVHLHGHPHVLLLESDLDISGGGGASSGAGSHATNTPASLSSGSRPSLFGGGGPQAPPTTAAHNAPTSVYRLPGGKCLPDEAPLDCLKRKLSKKIFSTATADAVGSSGGNVEDKRGGGGTMLPLAGAGMPHSPGGMPGSPGGLGLSAAAAYAIPVATVDLASTWQRPNFDGLMYPYRPPHLTASDVKEHRSLFVMQLEREAVFRVPDDFRRGANV